MPSRTKTDAQQPVLAPLPDGHCPWPGNDAAYRHYHDTEWGVPQTDDRALFEKLVLESFQSGLSWLTILRKRQNFRAAFAGFDPEVLANWGEKDVLRLLGDVGIIRNRAKIEATLSNARAYLALMERTSFARHCWDVVDGHPRQNRFVSMSEVPAHTPESTALARRLKGDGFRFFGPTTAYAFMQSMGLVNDHLIGCPRHASCAALAGDVRSGLAAR